MIQWNAQPKDRKNQIKSHNISFDLSLVDSVKYNNILHTRILWKPHNQIHISARHTVQSCNKFVSWYLEMYVVSYEIFTLVMASYEISTLVISLLIKDFDFENGFQKGITRQVFGSHRSINKHKFGSQNH